MRRIGTLVRATVGAVVLLVAQAAGAGPGHQSGNLANVTVMGETVMIQLDSGLPDNCAGTAYGWMMIPAQYKSMVALILAVWARGDGSSTAMTVYTSGLVNGYCQINQIDPLN